MDIPIESIFFILLLALPGYVGYKIFNILVGSEVRLFAGKKSEMEKLIIYCSFGVIGLFFLMLIPNTSGLAGISVQTLFEQITLSNLISILFYDVIASFFIGVFLFLSGKGINSGKDISNDSKLLYWWKLKKVPIVPITYKKPSILGIGRDYLIDDLYQSKTNWIFTFINEKGVTLKGNVISFSPKEEPHIVIRLLEPVKIGNSTIEKGENAILRLEEIKTYFLKVPKESFERLSSKKYFGFAVFFLILSPFFYQMMNYLILFLTLFIAFIIWGIIVRKYNTVPIKYLN